MKKIVIISTIFIIFFYNVSLCDDNSYLDDSDNSDNYLLYETSEVSTSSNEPNTYSKNIIVIDRKTLRILYEKDAYSKVAMASTTKIMTCIIALEKCSLLDTVIISKKSATVTGSTLGLKENSKISFNDLLYGLMLRSGNDCAIAIAEHISGTVENYIDLMNNKALELGLKNTHFVSPHGLDDDEHYTTAYDLAILTDYALKNDTFKKIVSTKNYNITLNGFTKNIINTNELLNNVDGVYGVKTGFTFNAGRCLVTSCKRNNMDIIIVVLGANTKKIRGLDTLNLINYIYTNFKYIDISKTIDESFLEFNKKYLKRIILKKTSDFPIIKLEKKDNYLIPLKTNGNLKLLSKIYMPNILSPKSPANKAIGTLYIYNNNDLLCNINIYLDKKLSPNSWQFYYKKIFHFFKE